MSGAASMNTQFAASPATLGDSVMSNISGCRDAQKLTQAVREGCASQDALIETLDLVLATADRVRLQGFCREIQKRLERA